MGTCRAVSSDGDKMTDPGHVMDMKDRKLGDGRLQYKMRIDLVHYRYIQTFSFFATSSNIYAFISILTLCKSRRTPIAMLSLKVTLKLSILLIGLLGAMACNSSTQCASAYGPGWICDMGRLSPTYRQCIKVKQNNC